MVTETHTILFVSNWFSVSSQQYSGYTPQLVLKLTERGWHLITTSSRSHRVIRALDMCHTAWRARKSYTVGQVDVFSGPAFLWAEAVCWLLRRLRKPYILTLHGGSLPAFAQRYPTRVQRLISSAAAVTTPSCYLKEAFAEVRDDILLLRYGIDLGPYQYQKRLKPAARLAWLRAFHSIYNPSLAARTIALLVSEFPDITLAMYGPDKADGSLRAVQEYARHAGIAEWIQIAGPIPKAEVPHALAPYDIFLNTTTAESFGVSVMEAAALGMCIVTTNVGELSYLWQDGENALLVPSDDPKAMVNAVRRILTEPGLAERLSRNARAKAEQFDWSVVLPQWEWLLTQVAGQRRT